MAIKRYAGDRFTGLSTDTKPVNVLSGAQFTELDSGFVFFFNGTSWDQSSYVHAIGFSDQPANPLTGVSIISRVNVNDEGHVTGVDTRDLTFGDFQAAMGYVGGAGVEIVDQDISVDLEINGGLRIDNLSQTLGVDPTIAGTALNYSNGVLNHDAGTARNVTASTLDVISNIVVNSEGHVTDIQTRTLPVGNDSSAYSHIAPLVNDPTDGLIIPASYLPRSAKSSKVVATIAERDAIPVGDRFEGLRVHVLDASADTSVESDSAGYILATGLDNTAWAKTYEEESLDVHVPLADGPAERIQLSAGANGDFTSSADFRFRVTDKNLDITGGVRLSEGGNVPSVAAGQVYNYVTTEVVGTDTITRVLSRLGDGTDVIVASYVA